MKVKGSATRAQRVKSILNINKNVYRYDLTCKKRIIIKFHPFLRDVALLAVIAFLLSVLCK